MDCPDCRRPLIVIELKGVELDYCVACGGIWFDEGELELILGRSEVLSEPGGLISGPRGKRPCPHCRRKMRTGPFPGTRVEVDACSAGHGIWMDRGELRAIIGSGACGGDAAALADYFERTLGGGPERREAGAEAAGGDSAGGEAAGRQDTEAAQ